MTVGARSDAGAVNKRDLPAIDGTVLTALCECGQVATIDLAKPLTQAPACVCGLRTGEGIMRGPHREALVREHLPKREAEERTRVEAENVVYFARIGNIIKIGTTGDLAHRLGQHGWPALLGVLDGGYTREHEMHTRFRHLRVSGELFEAKPELLEFIAAECYLPEITTPPAGRNHALPATLDDLALS